MNLIKSNLVPIRGAVISKQGGRPDNQDDFAFLDTPLGFLLIVCDGMGGGPGGKTASYIAKYEIAKTLSECSPQTPKEYAIKMAVSRAHSALEAKMKEVPSLVGMGSTFVAILIDNAGITVAHTGDSRCYILRGRRCIFRSTDHSLVAELIKCKALTEEEARVSPQSNVITRGLGSTSNHVPDIEEFSYKCGDRIVLCTDGVWGCMPHKELLKRITQKEEVKQLVTDLSTEVDRIGFSNGGHHDNHTLAVVELDCSSMGKKRSWKSLLTAGLFTVILLLACFITYKTCMEERTEESLVETDSLKNSKINNLAFSAKKHEYILKTFNQVSELKAYKDDSLKIDSIIKEILGEWYNPKDSTSMGITQELVNKYERAKDICVDSESTFAVFTRVYQAYMLNLVDTLKNRLDSDIQKPDVRQRLLENTDNIQRTIRNKNNWVCEKDTSIKEKDVYIMNELSKKIADRQIQKLDTLQKRLEENR